MHTIQTSLVFSVVLIVLCALFSANPGMYARTQDLAQLSVTCQDENNNKKSIFEVRTKRGSGNRWDIEIGCPEKAYRLGKGLRDSLDLLID